MEANIVNFKLALVILLIQNYMMQWSLWSGQNLIQKTLSLKLSKKLMLKFYQKTHKLNVMILVEEEEDLEK